MNIKPINKLSTLIGVICGLILLPLTTQAAFTDSGAATGSGSTVRADAGSSGTVSGTYYYQNGSPNTSMWVATGGGQITGSNARLELDNPGNTGALQVNKGVIIGDHLEVSTTGPAGYGVNALSGTIILTNSDVETHGSIAHAIHVMGSLAYAEVSNGTVTTHNDNNAYGLNADGGGTLIATDLYVHTTGTRGLGAVAERGGNMELHNVTIECDNISQMAIIAYSDSTLIGEHVSVTSSGAGASVGANSTLTLTDSTITTTGIGNMLEVASNGELTISGGTLAGGGALLTVSGSSASAVNLIETEITGSGNINSTSTGTHTVTITGGSGIVGDVTNSGSGALGLNLNDSSVTGNINNNNGTVSSTGTSAINGDVNGSLEVSSGTLTVTGSVTVDSGQSVTGNGTLNVGGLEINDGGTLGGGLTIGTDSTERILVGLGSATLYHEFGDATETSPDTLKLGENIALDLSSIDDLSDFEFAFTDDVLDGNFTLILGEAESLENWSAEINGNIEGLTLSGQNKVTADISITLTGEGSTLTATLSNVTVTAVPEPSTYFLLGTGLGILLLAARYRRRNVQS